MIKNISILALLGLAMPASAQEDSLDLHGFHMAPSDDDLHDGLSTWRGEAHEQHSVGFNVLFEYAAQPLAKFERRGNVITRTPIIDDLTALNLGIFYAPHERVSVTAASPLYLTVDNDQGQSGMGLGDVRLAGSVGVLLPDEDKDVGFGLSVVPMLDIPGFYSTRSQLGLEGISGGGLIAASVTDSDKWDVSANVGIHLSPAVEYYNLRGEERLLTSVSGAYSVTEDVAIRGEWVFRPTLNKNEQPWSDSPMEAVLSARGHTGNNLGWTFGGSTALTPGAGAATWRVFAGMSFVLGARQTEVVEVEAEPCSPAYMAVTTTNDSGSVDVPMTVKDLNMPDSEPLDVESGDVLEIPAGAYHLNIEIPEAETPEPIVLVEEGKVVLLEPIYFEFDSADISVVQSQAVLTALVQTLQDYPELKNIQVVGHTDERGDIDYNQRLSQMRVESVVSFLVERGVDPDRLTPVGMGESSLLYEDCSTRIDPTPEVCHQINRRVEFLILD